MDKLGFLPISALAVEDSEFSGKAPTARDYLKVVPDPDVDVEAQVLSGIEAARLVRLVSALPLLERLVLTWHFGLVGGTVSRRKIADRLRLSPANVRQIENHALNHLRSAYRAEGEAA